MSSELRTEKRRALGIPDECSVLINLGRLGTEKNVDELLQFFSNALTQKKDLFLPIVGDGPAREQLEQLAQSLGIADHVRFTGMICRQNLCLEDVIVQGENGYTYTCEEEFLNSINIFIDDPKKRMVAGKRSEEIAKSYDKKVFGDSIERIYKLILQNGSNEG